MSRKIKVYGCNYDGRSRRIVAAKSMAEAARLCNINYHHFREYGCETGNDKEIEMATREPLAVWSQGYSFNSEWKIIKFVATQSSTEAKS